MFNQKVETAREVANKIKCRIFNFKGKILLNSNTFRFCKREAGNRSGRFEAKKWNGAKRRTSAGVPFRS